MRTLTPSILDYRRYDVALPSATQNELDENEAEEVIKRGARYVAEGSNMGCTEGAIGVFEKSRVEKGKQGCWYGPGKVSPLAFFAFPPLPLELVLTVNLKTRFSYAGQQLWWCRSFRSRDGTKQLSPHLGTRDS